MWIPKGICNGLDSTVRKFIWCKPAVGRGIHLVNWNIIAIPKACGGLGIREACLMNVSLLGKLIWSLLRDNNKLWTRDIV